MTAKDCKTCKKSTRPQMPKLDDPGARKGLYIVAVSIMVLYLMIIMGCVSASPGIPNTFLIALQAQSKGIDGVLRIAYFGICLVGAGDNAKCMATSFSTSQHEVALILFNDARLEDSLAIARNALDLQRKFLANPLVAAAPIFFGGILAMHFHGQHRGCTPPPGAETLTQDFDGKESNGDFEARKRAQDGLVVKAKAKQQRLLALTTGAYFLSTLLGLLAAVSTTVTVNAISYISTIEAGDKVITAGVTLQTLQWVTIAVSVMFCIGFVMMSASQKDPKENSTDLEKQAAKPHVGDKSDWNARGGEKNTTSYESLRQSQEVPADSNIENQ